jgi:hypothetical protein
MRENGANKNEKKTGTLRGGDYRRASNATSGSSQKTDQ